MFATVCPGAAPASETEGVAAPPVLDSRSAVTAFEQIWNLTQEQIYPPRIAATHFDEATYRELRDRISTLDSVDALPAVLNPFLDSLGISHTQLYAKHDLEYAFLRSLFSTREPDQPPFSHFGVQLLYHGDRWWVREVFDGLPADRAGVERGDALLRLDGKPFTPQRMCDGGERHGSEAQSLELRRGRRVIRVSLPCVRQNPHASMHDAMTSSVRTIDLGDREVGYLHLWTGTGAEGLERYRAAVARLKDTDALILDLRGGFGGAWYEHLDPFFADREGFFSFTVINREGSTLYPPGAHETAEPYTRPMAVLINEGTRSGKEAVAFQFKKSGRAALIGTTTRGAFSAGKGLFVDDDGPLVYYLAVAEYRLDGQRIEGVGVAPDIVVPDPVIRADDLSPGQYREDAPLAAALAYLADVLAGEESQPGTTSAGTAAGRLP
ncbi:MAG: S41 family peptidase [Halieaceae bacterium]|nr:S41 family peptidase [Halieaceae bacterium]